MTKKKASDRVRRGDKVPGGAQRCVRLKALRLACDLGSQELADKSGIERPEISQIETGRNLISSVAKVEALAKGFGIHWTTMEFYLRGDIPLAEVLSRRARGDTERTPARSPLLEDRPELKSGDLLEEARAVASRWFGDLGEATWAELPRVRDSEQYPRPLNAEFVTWLAKAIQLGRLASS